MPKFKNKTKVGDLIIISDGNYKFRAIGEISGNYELLPDSDDAPRYVQKKSVKSYDVKTFLKKLTSSVNISLDFNTHKLLLLVVVVVGQNSVCEQRCPDSPICS